MQYLMLICVDELFAPSADEQAAIGVETDEWVTEMDGRGVRREGNALQSVAEARTVRVRGDDVLISDGPFAETKEFIAGYDLIECTNIDEAIEIASRHPMARHGAIDIRPFWTA